MTNDENSKDLLSTSTLGIITSLIASAIFFVASATLGVLGIYTAVTPHLAWIIIIVISTIAIGLLVQFVFSKFSLRIIETFFTITSTLFYIVSLLFIIHLLYIVSIIIIQYSNDPKQLSMAFLERPLIEASTIAMCGCGLCVIRVFTIYTRITLINKEKNTKNSELISELSDVKNTLSSANDTNQQAFNSISNKITTFSQTTQQYLEKAQRDVEEKKQTDKDALSDISNKIQELSEDFQKIRRIKGMNSAMTSTIIPFKQSKNNTISTYLIANSAYPEYSWMFPGGHVYFEEQQTPESVAKSRAEDEAGVEVNIVDIYNSFDVKEKEEMLVDNMNVFFPPHYLNLFKLDDRAKCYREYGHEYHIDAVYVAEIKNVSNIGNYKRIEIVLPRAKIEKEVLKDTCMKELRKYYDKHRITGEKRQLEPSDYVIEMLYCAFNDYVMYLNKEESTHE